APGVVKLGELIADSPEHVGADLAAAVGDDARPKLYDQAAHEGKVRTPRQSRGPTLLFGTAHQPFTTPTRFSPPLHGLAGPSAHGLGIVASFFGSLCMTMCVARG